MADDLVERLRLAVNELYRTPPCGLMNEAADRIEQLEAALREISEKTRDAHPMSYLADYFRIARAALEGK